MKWAFWQNLKKGYTDGDFPHSAQYIEVVENNDYLTCIDGLLYVSMKFVTSRTQSLVLDSAICRLVFVI